MSIFIIQLVVIAIVAAFCLYLVLYIGKLKREVERAKKTYGKKAVYRDFSYVTLFNGWF